MFKKILSDSVVYGAARVVMMGISIFLVPIYSRHFSLGDYGVMETFNMFINLAMLILPCGISQSVFMSVYKYETPAEKRRFFSTVYGFYFGVGIIFLAVNLTFHLYFTRLLIQDTGYSKIFMASCLAVFFQLLNNYNLDILRSQFQKLQYLIVSVGTVLFLAIGGIVTVLKFNWGIKGFFYASAFAHLFFWLVGTMFNLKWLSFSFSKDDLWKVMRKGLPFVPAGLSLVLMKFLDRFVVQRVLGLDELGLYAMSIKVSTLFDIVGTAFAAAWFPWAMKIAETPDAKEQYRNLFLKIVVTLALLALFFASLSKVILHILVDSKFWSCAPMIFLLLLGSLINFYNYVAGVGLYASGKTKFISLPPIAGGLANLIFCYVLAKMFGLPGVAASVVLGSMAYLGVSYYLSEKVYPIGFALMKATAITAVLFLLMMIINWADSQSAKITIQEIGIKAAILLGSFLLIYNMKIFNFKTVLQEIKNRAMQKFKGSREI